MEKYVWMDMNGYEWVIFVWEVRFAAPSCPIHSMGSLGSSMPDGDLCSEVGPQPNQIWGGDTVWKPTKGYSNTGNQSKIGKKKGMRLWVVLPNSYSSQIAQQLNSRCIGFRVWVEYLLWMELDLYHVHPTTDPTNPICIGVGVIGLKW